MSTLSFNILITSLSRKVPLIKAVRKGLEKGGIEGKVVGGDVNPNCVGSYFVDQFWHMPPLSGLSSEEFLSFCSEFGIKAVIPTRDGELMYFAENRDAFAAAGVKVMVSPGKSIEQCNDKLKFFQTMSSLGYPVIEADRTLNNLKSDFYVVKERVGAGGKLAGVKLSRSEAAAHAAKLKNPLFQPYIEGDEVSVDVYVDKGGKGKGAVARKRELVVDGESQITTAFRDEVLEGMCIKMAESLELYGHVMFQLIQEEEGKVYHVLECNPRFGGASPLSLEMGLDSFTWFFLEVAGEDLSTVLFHRSHTLKRLVRYPEDLIIA